jgi:glycosyltransferase 2 family protein
MGALWFLTHKLGAEELMGALSHASWSLLAGCTVLYLITQFLSAWRWMAVARAMNFSGDYRRYLSLYFLGMFYNIFLPTGYGGDVIKLFYQAPLRKRPSKTLAALSIFLDRLAGFVALLFFGGLASLGLSAKVALGWGILLSVLLIVAIVGGMALVWFASRWKKTPRKLRLAALLMRARAKDFWGVGLLSVLIQGLNVVIYAWIFAALGASLSLWQITFGYALVTIATLLPVSVGGLGVRESGWAGMMVAFGEAPAVGVMAGLIYFAVQTISSAFGFWPFWGLRQTSPHGCTPLQS